MDWLLQVKDALEQEVFGRVANLLDLGVDLLFFDTTSTYFELGGEDGPVPLDKHGNKTGRFAGFGKSAMAANDLVVAMTGASGAPYGLRLLEVLLKAGRTVHFTLT